VKQQSYSEALTMLGQGESRLMNLVDKLSTGAIFVGAVFTGGAAFSLVDAKNDFVRYGKELSGQIAARRLGLQGKHRSELLIAAHSVIVITAFVQAFEDLARSPSGSRRTKAWHEEDLELLQRRLTRLAGTPTDTFTSDIAIISMTPVPHPDPALPFEELADQISTIYRRFFDAAYEFMTEIAVWDRLDDNDRTKYAISRQDVARDALEYYRGLYCRLAADCPEFFFWANLQDSQAIRAIIKNEAGGIQIRLMQLLEEVADSHNSMAGLEELMRRVGAGNALYAATSSAIRARAELDWPIVDAGPLNANRLLRFPRLSEGYINPSGRVAPHVSKRRLAEEKWWDGQRLVKDLQRSITATIIGPNATEVPTVVLGQPGAGKSVFTRVLAARLSEIGFLVIRVELRRVEPDATIQAQIEQSIERATGERTTWPELVRSAPTAPRLLILDGFDELLQATGSSRSDYLERVQEFQSREQELGRPVATLVTSRTIVADRVRYPDGSQIIRLEPFSGRQIALWTQMWNQTNAPYFSSESVAPFSAGVAIQSYGDLAAQPLLLLMLALYDAEGNPLQRNAGNIRRGQLYQGLLERFVTREVMRNKPSQSDDEARISVELELTRLSVVAFAIFNRNRQSVLESELDRDLEALQFPAEEALTNSPNSFSGRLSPARRLVGRFFFIYDPNVVIEGASTSAYEFLHATFGEYLVSRFTEKVLWELNENHSRLKQAMTMPSTGIDDGLLFALLSFNPLATRAAILEFLREEFASVDTSKILALRTLLLRIKTSATPSPPRSFGSYEPVRYPASTREAIYSANLLTMILTVSGEPLIVDEFLGATADPLASWSRLCHFWKSQLSPEAWRGIVNSLNVERGSHRGVPSVRVSFTQAGDLPEYCKEWIAPEDLGLLLERARRAGLSPEFENCLADLWMYGDPDLDTIFRILWR
jgi:hypothetical protein